MLEKFLKKVGVKSYLDLNPEERESYKVWEVALSGRRLTDEDVRKFLITEKEEVINKLASQKFNQEDDNYLKAQLRILINLQNFLNSPIIEKEIAEKQFEAIIESNLN